MAEAQGAGAESAGSPGGGGEVAAPRAIAAGTARATGSDFFPALVEKLAAVLGVRHAFVAVFSGSGRVRTLAFWQDGQLVDNVEWELAGTPCAEVVRGDMCHYPSGVQMRFPKDRALVTLGIESYLGVPLKDSAGQHLGHLAVFDPRPLPAEPRTLFLFRIFAARASAELERVRLERTLAESEERYRDLFEEAPIAYVHEDLQSRFIKANQAALRILGVRPEEVAGMVGRSLVPDTPEAQERVRAAFATLSAGTTARGVVLELRRKDTGEPLWIQWWSRPNPDGQSTRTMFIDITDRVRAEQEKARLEQQNQYLQEEIKAAHNFEEIIGRSPALLAALDNVTKVAGTETTVLITGETGTGKELFARAIHSHSRRRDKPFIKVNCAALPAGLVESELFGHEKGAFTGALARRLGRFELASGGTLFLDEIGELPADTQAKLLRVLQERAFERVGGTATIQVDVRVLAATNRDLQRAVAEQTFRQDLFYRLSVFPLVVPPLRDRRDDIPLLALFHMNRFAVQVGKQLAGIAPDTMRRLQAYSWPGNVRELENVLERAVILSSGPWLEAGPDLLSEAQPRPPPGASPRRFATLEEADRQHIRAALEQTGWVIDGPRGAARILGLHPNTLRSRLKKLGIHRTHHPA
ncbi:MAG TPA: sigma 54-interacting transcriptional regulator [Gemmatales bacterium]|nr:sigma 54-interacting transcriptional regulator [Gemmatales bacterium]